MRRLLQMVRRPAYLRLVDTVYHRPVNGVNNAMFTELSVHDVFSSISCGNLPIGHMETTVLTLRSMFPRRQTVVWITLIHDSNARQQCITLTQKDPKYSGRNCRSSAAYARRSAGIQMMPIGPKFGPGVRARSPHPMASARVVSRRSWRKLGGLMEAEKA
jgi:hypothetical protein